MNTVIVRILDFLMKGNPVCLFKNVAEYMCLWIINSFKSLFGCELSKLVNYSLRSLDMLL